jgi:transmembrane sensor
MVNKLTEIQIWDEMQNETSENPVLREALEWLVTLGDDRCNDASRADFSLWLQSGPLQQAAWEEAEALWDSLDPLGAEISALKARDKTISRRRALGALAGVAVVGTAGWTMRGNVGGDYQTAAGQTDTITLADGSRVNLGGRSAIDIEFSAGVRHVSLRSGEAFFNVASGDTRPFTVVALGANITAFGSAFNVNTWSEKGQVAVAKHAVSIRQPGRTAVRVEENWQAEFDGQKVFAATGIDSANIGAWRHGRLVFQSTPLRDVLDQISRYRGGRIAILDEKTGDIPITAVFDAFAPNEALDTITETLALKRMDLLAHVSILYV